MTKYAYATLCMKGDGYAPGVIAMAESIRLTSSKFDIVCMCTADVTEAAREIIRTVAKIHPVEYLQYESKPMATARQMELYGSWYDTAYTKWRCFELVEYTKVLFIDADIIVVQNIDHLFDLQAPAATFSSPWAQEFTSKSSFNLKLYPKDHGGTVSPEAILQVFDKTRSWACISSVVLLEPSLETLADYNTLISGMLPFGFNNLSSTEEQSIAYYYAIRGVAWRHIHQRYNFIVHKIEWLLSDDRKNVLTPHVLHYFSATKPWKMTTKFSESPYPTDRLWWLVMRKWWLRFKDTADMTFISRLDRFAEMQAAEKITIKNTKLISEMFPWITALQKPFPELF